jgi:hypothetical protein
VHHQSSYKPKADTALTEPRDNLFDGATTHGVAFQRWKADRLQQLNTMPAAGECTGGVPGREPPTQVGIGWFIDDRSNTFTTTHIDYGNTFRSTGERAVAAGLPTSGLDRYSARCR